MGQLVYNLGTDEILFVIKGSDESIMSLLSNSTEIEKVFKISTELAKEGLRTLVFA